MGPYIGWAIHTLLSPTYMLNNNYNREPAVEVSCPVSFKPGFSTGGVNRAAKHLAELVNGVPVGLT